MAQKKRKPSIPNMLDYSEHLSMYDRENRVAEATLRIRRKTKRKQSKPVKKA
jgi:hypothetical protein